MKTFRFIYNTVAVLAVATLPVLTACSDDDDYTVGAADADDVMGVYFDADNPVDFIFIPGEGTDVTLTMHRLNTTAAASVPLLLTGDTEGITCPSTVDFEAGSADATIALNFDGIPVKQTVSFAIGVPAEYTNHYSATLYNYESTALISAWESANTDGSPVTFYFTSDDGISLGTLDVTPVVYEPIQCEMEVLPGAGKIRIQNFMGAGNEMVFSFTPSPIADYEGLYRVCPETTDLIYSFVDAYGDESYAETYYNAYFIMADASTYGTCYLNMLSDGSATTLSYPYVFWYSSTAEYSYASLKSTSQAYNAVCMGIGGTPSGVSLPTYFNLFFSWDGNSGL